MSFKMKFSDGTPFHFHGGDPSEHVSGGGDEKKVSTEVTKKRVTKPSGQTGTLVTIKDNYKTPGGEAKRTIEGDKAYAAKTKKQRKVQDEAYLAKNRSASRERFIGDPISIEPKGSTNMPNAKIKTSIDISKDIFNREFNKSEPEANFDLRQDLYKRKYEGVDRGSMSNTEKLAQNKYSKLRKTAEQRSDASKAAKKQKAKHKLKKALTIDLSRKGARKGSMRGKAGCPAGKC
tara:strand:+ start:189 stop:887 length:699 start_codon:yes stop_codon:yes gene_type:complete